MSKHILDFGKLCLQKPNITLRCCAQKNECATPSKIYDDATRAQVLELRASGNSYAAIESALGIPLSDVIKIVKPSEQSENKQRIRPRHQRQAARALRTARWTFKRIGEHLGIAHSTAHRFASDIKIPRRQGDIAKDTETVVKRKQRIAEARQMRRDGATLLKIAERFDVTTGTASKWCKGIAPPIDKEHAEMIAEARQMRRREDTLEKIGNHFGVTHQAVGYWTRDIPNPRRLTVKRSKPPELTKKREKAYLMCQSGMPLTQIGKFFGVDRSTIFRWVEWYCEEKITNEVLYFYKRDTYGMPIEVERQKVAPSGEIRIERQRL